MYTIKHQPEDFVVNEQYNFTSQQEGKFGIFLLKKRNYTTIDALKSVARTLNVPLSDIGFAGNKDKQAITTQYISVFKPSSTKGFSHDELTLEFIGWSDERIALGQHQGNEFIITVRNLEEQDLTNLDNLPTHVPNYFGPQRFSKNNHLVGKAIIKKRFQQAVELLLENHGAQEQRIREFLDSHPNNFIGALQTLPKKVLSLYVGAYQSWLFNKTVQLLTQGEKDNLDIPLFGYSLNIFHIENNKLKEIIKSIMEKEELTSRDFLVRSFPSLSLEGATRPLFFQPKNFKIVSKEKDDCFPNKQKATISFTLPPSCYATTLLSVLFNKGKDIINNFT